MAASQCWTIALVNGGSPSLVFTGRGMTGFAHVLSPEEAQAIRAYVVSQAKASIDLCNSEYRESYPEVVGSACVRAQTAASR